MLRRKRDRVWELSFVITESSSHYGWRFLPLGKFLVRGHISQPATVRGYDTAGPPGDTGCG